MARRDDERVITTASSRGRSLDVEERQRRYTISMTVRTVCFLLFLVVPGWWKIVALAGAALIPAFAVVLANGEDHRPAAVEPEDDDRSAGPRALPRGPVIRGDVEDVEQE